MSIGKLPFDSARSLSVRAILVLLILLQPKNRGSLSTRRVPLAPGKHDAFCCLQKSRFGVGAWSQNSAALVQIEMTSEKQTSVIMRECETCVQS
jgi:hypothetical protein